MGIRLYPNTKDRTKLEVLAGVPAGTYDRLEAIETKHREEAITKRASGTWSEYSDGYRQWQEINNDPHLGDLCGFLLYGWGKFNDPDGLTNDDNHDRSCSGSLSGEPAARLLEQNGVDPKLATLGDGIHWC
jgi:hypothetical protein